LATDIENSDAENDGATLRSVEDIICAMPLTPPRLFCVGAESAMKICVHANVG